MKTLAIYLWNIWNTLQHAFLPFFFSTMQSRAENGRFQPAGGRGWWYSLAAASYALHLDCARPAMAPSLGHGSRRLHGGRWAQRRGRKMVACARMRWRWRMEATVWAGMVENIVARRSRWTTLRQCGRCFEWRATFLSGDSSRTKENEDERRRKVVGSFGVSRPTATWASSRLDAGVSISAQQIA
jgi:hypothetical protein